jgi:phage-related minor tail protein
MTEERKVQLAATVDATGATEGFDQIKQGAKDMAQAVGQAGQSAGKAIDGIGAGGSGAAAKVDATARSLIGSIQRTTAVMEAGSRTSSQYYEVLANQRGVNVDVLRPYLAQLDAVTAKQKSATEALRATAEAAATIKPGEVESTAGAMEHLSFGTAAAKRELLVLTHELSQGNFKRFGGSLLVLGEQTGAASLLFSTAGLAALGLVAGIAALGFAYIKGAAESKAYTDSLILSGNAAGSTASQLQAMAVSLTSIGFTQHAAAGALAEFAASGVVAQKSLEAFAAAALQFERATGTAIDKTVEKFAELAKSPLEASIKLNEQTNYLTLAIYQQIKALEDQGRTTEAANLAQKAFADTLSSRSGDILANLGTIERGWHGIKDAIKGAIDAALNLGRVQTTAQRLVQVQGQIATATSQNPAVSVPGESGAAAAVRGARIKQAQDLLETNKELEKSLFRRLQIEDGNAAALASQAAQVKARIQFDKEGDTFLTKREKLEKEVTKARNEGVAAGASEVEIQRRIADIREKFKPAKGGSGSAVTGENEVAGINAKIKEAQALLVQLQSDAPIVKLTEGEKLVIKIQEELTTSIHGVARAQKEKALTAAQALAVVDKQVATEENYRKALAESEKALNSQVDAARKQADSIEQQARGQEAINVNFGKGKTAAEEATLAQFKLQQAEAEGSDRFAPAYVAALEAKTAAQKRFVEQLQQTEFKQEKLKLTEAARVSNEETKTLELELSLIGRTQIEREKILGQRKAELALAKQLAAIDKLNLGDGPEADLKRSELRAQAQADFVVNANNSATKAVLAEWQRTADSINNSLTDALLRGFEAGKSFALNLRDTVVNLFKTLILRPTISAIISPISGAISQAVSSIGGAGGATSLLGGGSSLLSGGSSLLGLLGSGGSLGAGLATGFGAIGGGLAGIGGAVSAGAGLIGAGSFAGGAGLIVGALGPIALGIGALVLLAKNSHGPKTEGGFAPAGLNIAGLDIGGNLQGSQRGDVAGAQKISEAISASYQALADQLGLVKKQLDVGIFFSKDPKGDSQTQLQVTSSTGYDRSKVAGGIENVGRSDADLQAAIAVETERVLLDALKKSDIAQQYKDILNGVAASAGTAEIEASIKRVTAARTQQLTLEEQLYQLTHTDAEKLIRTREQERAAVDPLNAALLNEVYAQQDLAKATTAATAASQAQAQAFSAYQSNFYTADEQKRIKAQAILDKINAVTSEHGEVYHIGDVLDANRETFRKVAEGIDQTTDYGKRLYNTMIEVSQSFADISSPLATTVTATAAVTSAANGYTSALTSQAVAQTQAQQALLSAGKSISDFIRQLATTRAGTASPADLLTSTRNSYLADLSASRTGNLDALGRVTNSAQAYIDAQKGAATSNVGVQAVISQVIGELSSLPSVQSYEQQSLALLQQLVDAANGTTAAVNQSAATIAAAALTPSQVSYLATGQLSSTPLPGGLQAAPTDGSIPPANPPPGTKAYGGSFDGQGVWHWNYVPAFAVGTNYVPRDTLAMVHEGEAIIPKAFNPWTGGGMGGDTSGEIAALRATMDLQQVAFEAMADSLYQARTALQEIRDRGVVSLNNPDGTRLLVTTT